MPLLPTDVYGQDCLFWALPDGIVSEKLPLDINYLPRQAYYLTLMPVVLLTVPTEGKTFFTDLLRNHSRILFFWGVVPGNNPRKRNGNIDYGDVFAGISELAG